MLIKHKGFNVDYHVAINWPNTHLHLTWSIKADYTGNTSQF